MRHFNFLFLLLMSMFCTSAFADDLTKEVTIDELAAGQTTDGEFIFTTGDYVSNASNPSSYAPGIDANKSCYGLYMKDTLTVTSKSGYYISKLTFNIWTGGSKWKGYLYPNPLTVSTGGSYETSEDSTVLYVIPSEAASTITFIMGNKRLLTTSLTITYSTEEPVVKDPEVSTIADLKALGTGNNAILNLAGMKVTLQVGSDCYIQDNDGNAMLFQKCDVMNNLESGQTITSGKINVFYTENSNKQPMVNLINSVEEEIVTEDGTPAAEKVETISTSDESTLYHYVAIVAKVIKTVSGTKTRYYINEDGGVRIFASSSYYGATTIADSLLDKEVTVEGVIWSDGLHLTGISTKVVTAINAIETKNVENTGNVYSIDGRLVRRNATSLEGLPKGIYIYNGKKVVK